MNGAASGTPKRRGVKCMCKAWMGPGWCAKRAQLRGTIVCIDTRKKITRTPPHFEVIRVAYPNVSNWMSVKSSSETKFSLNAIFDFEPPNHRPAPLGCRSWGVFLGGQHLVGLLRPLCIGTALVGRPPMAPHQWAHSRLQASMGWRKHGPFWVTSDDPETCGPGLGRSCAMGVHMNLRGAMHHQLGPPGGAWCPTKAPFGACLRRGGQNLGRHCPVV